MRILSFSFDYATNLLFCEIRIKNWGYGMKDYNTIKKFIILRSSGLTYNEITEKINVSRPTLVKWNKEYKDEIDNYENYIFADLYARHIVLDLGSIYINTSHLKQIDEIDRPTEWEMEVHHRALKKLKKRFLKDIKSMELITSNSGRIKEIKIEFFDNRD
jgi:DNA-binding XRE family transcriptional regulator